VQKIPFSFRPYINSGDLWSSKIWRYNLAQTQSIALWAKVGPIWSPWSGICNCQSGVCAAQNDCQSFSLFVSYTVVKLRGRFYEGFIYTHNTVHIQIQQEHVVHGCFFYKSNIFALETRQANFCVDCFCNASSFNT
jgi:hypothetical protein